MSDAKTYNFQVPMSSPVYEVTEQFRKSSARYVKGIKVGDKLRFTNALYAKMSVSGHGHNASDCYVLKVLPNGDEEIVTECYVSECEKAYFTGGGEFDYDAPLHTCGFTPVFRIEEV